MVEQINPQQLYAPEDFQPHWLEDLPETVYHGNKTAVGSSSLRTVLDSPKAFYWGFFKGYEKEDTDSMKLGRMIHLAVLEGEKFKQRYVVMPEFEGYTKSGELTKSRACSDVKRKESAWLADQRPDAVVCTEKEREMIIGIIEGILSHQDARRLFLNGRPEVSGFYRDPETGIRCKIRPDFLSFNHKVFTDLKSAKSARRYIFGAEAFRRRYDMQVFMYAEGTQIITGTRPAISPLVVVEKVWPFECAVYTYHEGQTIQTEIDYRNALRKLKVCIDSNNWPQRQEKAEHMHVPRFFIDESVEESENEYAG